MLAFFFMINFEQLFQFSESLPYHKNFGIYQNLYSELEQRRLELNFPAVRKDVGMLLSFFCSLKKPKKIFEFGSGFGMSAFYYLWGSDQIEKIYLTEKREDLKPVFESLPWPQDWKEKIDYFNGDAFRKIEDLNNLDFVLIDGEKAFYLDFLKILLEKLSDEGIVFIDNAFLEGKILDPQKNKERQMLKMHEYIKDLPFDCLFLPFRDGVTIIQKRN
jgi:predicted O-methyltransferase YrrM